MNARKIAYMAMLTAIALTIFMVEAQLPGLSPIPGIKLGLANIVTVYAMFALGPGPTLMILLCRVFLGSVFSGQLISFFYSLGGGLLCYLSMLVMRRLVTKKQIWACSAVGAIFHNIGQICVAVIITRIPAVAAYLPFLIITGVITGLFTGLCAQYVVNRLSR